MSGDLAFWLVWMAGSLTFLVCLSILWWGLFGDRARGRRRCPRCWYDMSHNGMTCPECGGTASREKHLFRTRRRLAPALLAAIIASVGASYAIEQANDRGWMTLVPTRAVLMGLPFAGTVQDPLATELTSRLSQRKLTESHLRSLVKRCVRGDMFARPVTAEWEEKYGALLQRCRWSLPDGFGLDESLLKIPASIELSSGRVWPLDAPICLDLDVREWWPAGTQCRVVLTPTWDPSEPITVWRDAAQRGNSQGNPRNRRQERPLPLVIAEPPNLPRLDFDVVLERLVPGEDTQWEQVQAEAISVEVEFAGNLTDEFEPSLDEKLQEAMRSTFGLGVMKWTGGRSPVRVRFDPRQTEGLGSDDTLIGAAIEILREGTLARRLEIWWPVNASGRGNMGWVVAYEDEDLITEANDSDGRWQMIVRGDPTVALRAGKAARYWAGEFTVPLSITEVETEAPRKYWWRKLHPRNR